jgi:hypothetical protein
MLARRIGPASLLVAAFTLPACGTVNRAGEDALVVGMFPVHAITMPYEETASAIKDDGASPWASPVLFMGHLAEDVGVTAISAGDLGISPALGVAEVAAPDSMYIRPLRMYSFERFPPEFRKSKARDVESDVAKGAAQTALVVAVVGAFCVAAYYGGGFCPQSSTSGWANSPPTAPTR